MKTRIKVEHVIMFNLDNCELGSRHKRSSVQRALLRCELGVPPRGQIAHSSVPPKLNAMSYRPQSSANSNLGAGERNLKQVARAPERCTFSGSSAQHAPSAAARRPPDGFGDGGMLCLQQPSARPQEQHPAAHGPHGCAAHCMLDFAVGLPAAAALAQEHYRVVRHGSRFDNIFHAFLNIRVLATQPHLHSIVYWPFVPAHSTRYWGLARCGHHCFNDGRSARHLNPQVIQGQTTCRFCANGCDYLDISISVYIYMHMRSGSCLSGGWGPGLPQSWSVKEDNRCLCGKCPPRRTCRRWPAFAALGYTAPGRASPIQPPQRKSKQTSAHSPGRVPHIQPPHCFLLRGPTMGAQLSAACRPSSGRVFFSLHYGPRTCPTCFSVGFFQHFLVGKVMTNHSKKWKMMIWKGNHKKNMKTCSKLVKILTNDAKCHMIETNAI